MADQLIEGVGPTEVDFIEGGVAHGPVANQLLNSGFDYRRLRPYFNEKGEPRVVTGLFGNEKAVPTTHATLRKDEWKQYDTAVIEAAQLRLDVVQAIMGKGLVLNIPNGLGKTVLQYEDVSDMNAAEISMDAVTRGDNDRIVYEIRSMPLPIIHKSFQINARVLAASRTTGDPLDVTQAALAAFKVAEKVEEITVAGSSSYTFGGGVVYGIEDAPNKNTETLALDWDDSAKTGALILDDVRAMKQASITARHQGPWMLLIPPAYETVLDDDHTTGYPKTIRSRILEVDKIDSIIVADKLTADTVALVQTTPDVIRMVQGMPITTVEWQTEGNMIFHFKVMTILVPQVRYDQNSRSGITILS